MKNRDLIFTIKMRNAAKAALQNFKGDLQGVAEQSRKAGTAARKSGDQVRKQGDSIRKTGQEARKARGNIVSLGRAMQALAGAFAVREAVRLADEYTNIQNRLKLVTSGTEELAVVTDRLFTIANKTRSAYNSTAELYARVGLAAKDLGVSQQELLNFTESLNQAVILSGAGADEASAGIIQLSQGLASGALRGDELRSVLEQLPMVADVIAKSLGVTRGELRKMGQDGAITADVVLTAFREAREELENNFAQTAPTIGQSFTVLRNKVVELWGEFTTSSGIASGLATVLLTVANNLGTITRVATAAGIAFATVFAVKGVAFAITRLKLFIATVRTTITSMVALQFALGATTTRTAILGLALKAIQAIPIVRVISLLGVALVSAAAAVVAFSDQIKISGDVTQTAEEKIASNVKQVDLWKQQMQAIKPALNDATNSLSILNNVTGENSEAAKNAANSIALAGKNISEAGSDMDALTDAQRSAVEVAGTTSESYAEWKESAVRVANEIRNIENEISTLKSGTDQSDVSIQQAISGLENYAQGLRDASEQARVFERNQRIAANGGLVLSDLLGGVWDVFVQDIKRAGEELKSFTSGLLNIDPNMDWEPFLQETAAAIDTALAYVDNFPTVAGAYMDQWAAMAQVAFNNAINYLITEFVNPAMKGVTDFVNGGIRLITGFAGGVRGALQAIPGIFSAIFQNAMAHVARIVQTGINGIASVLNLLPGIDIGSGVDLVGLVGDFQEIPSIAAAAGAEARSAMASAFQFQSPELAKVRTSAAQAARAAGAEIGPAMERAQQEWLAQNNGGLQAFVADAFEFARERADGRIAGDVDLEQSGTATPVASDDKSKKKAKSKKSKADKEAKALADAIRNLAEELFPARERLDEFNEKMQLLARIRPSLTIEEHAQSLQRLREQYGDLSGPVAQFNLELDKEQKLMNLTGRSLELASLQADLTADKIRDVGRALNIEEQAQIKATVARYDSIEAARTAAQANEDLRKQIELIDLESSLSGGGRTNAEREREIELERYKIDELERVGLKLSEQHQWNALQIADYDLIIERINRYSAALDRAEAAQATQRADAIGGLREGISEWAKQAQDVHTQMSQFASQTLNGLTNVISDFVTTGKASFGDFARSAIASLTQIIAKMLLLRALGLPTGGGGSGGGILSGIFHGGGMVGDQTKQTRNVAASTFQTAKRFHKGGMPGSLRAGERPVIALNTERILNPEETRAYNAGEAASRARANTSAATTSTMSRSGGASGDSSFVFAPQVTMDMGGGNGGGDNGGLSPEEMSMVGKSLEEDMNGFMAKWVERERRPGGMLDIGRRK